MIFKDKKRAFTLIELLTAVCVICILSAAAYTSGWRTVRRFTDPRSDLLVASEVENAAEWLRSVVTRALWTGADFRLTLSRDGAKDWIRVTWVDSGKTEEWKSGRVAFKSLATGSAYHNYSSKFQMLSPALTIKVYHGDNRTDVTDWSISISGYGFVKRYRIS